MSKFNQERAALIIKYLKQGTELGRAAERARVTRQTVWNWRREGRNEGQGPKFEFDLEVTRLKAERIAQAENRVLQIMQDKSDNRSALNAAKWYLEKQAPDEYGSKADVNALRQELALELMDVLRERLDDGQYAAVCRALAPSAGGGGPPPKELPE